MPFSPGVPWMVLKQASNFKISPFFRFTEKSALLSSFFLRFRLKNTSLLLELQLCKHCTNLGLESRKLIVHF
jgi:hypothetical protein